MEFTEINYEISNVVKELDKLKCQQNGYIISPEQISNQKKIKELEKKLEELETVRENVMNEMLDVFENGDGSSDGGDGEKAVCESCGNYLIFDSKTSDLVCVDCGISDKIILNDENNCKYEDIPKKKNGGYKPHAHFVEVIGHFQGKRKTHAPDETYEKIKSDCERYHYNLKDVTPEIVKYFMKQRRLSDQYKHCVELAHRLSGKSPPYMTPMQENRVIRMFPYVVAGYITSPRYKERCQQRNGRKKSCPNLMNYYFVFYKLCELCGFHEFLPYIPLPKNTQNIDDNDENAWKHTCEFNNWEYIPTR